MKDKILEEYIIIEALKILKGELQDYKKITEKDKILEPYYYGITPNNQDRSKIKVLTKSIKGGNNYEN